MPIKTTCPSCKQAYTLGDNFAGKKVKCKACQKAFTIPDPKAAREPEEEAVEVALADDGDEPKGGLFDRAKKKNANRHDEDEDRPRRRSRDDEDDRPRSRRDRDDPDEDDRPRKRKKKARGGMPPWAWIAIGGGALLVVILLVVVLLFAFSGGAVTQENFAKINNGMTGDEVKKILGSPHETASNNLNRFGMGGMPMGFGGQGDVWVWHSGGNEIVVVLVNGRVAQKFASFDGDLDW